MPPNVDLVVVFRTNTISLSKQQSRDDALKAECQYTKLLETLTKAGLRAVGRRGETQGHILVLLSCPQSLLGTLVHRERHSDFIHGLPISSPVTVSADFGSSHLTPADRLRLIHTYITSMLSDGGLGIIPGLKEWDHVDSILSLHDRKFNEMWIRSWTTRGIAPVKLEQIREQFGDSVALYFCFLSSYTRALIFPSVLGTLFFLIGQSYSPLYSSMLCLWSIAFVEWWTIQERILSVRWGTRGSAKVEKRRASYIPGFPWWKRELRVVASIPVIVFFALVLAGLLTANFVLEVFVTHLYTGPGHKYISFSPTILVAALVPRILAIYQSSATRFTLWENHAHQSEHNASLTIKTFALSAIVAYLGLALSAFVYVPFGGSVMRWVQEVFYGRHFVGQVFTSAIGTRNGVDKKLAGPGVWLTAESSEKRKLNPSRLNDQMFAYTVTNQIVNTFTEIGLPYVLRFVGSIRNGKSKIGHSRSGSGGKMKRVVFEDEVVKQQQGNMKEKDASESEKEGKEDREFLERVRSEVALPPYELFVDYSEMVTQFGYVALWSTIWPLAPVMSLVNNFFELRSDAFKITRHNRRPLPMRTDSIGPWLESLSFLTWLSTLTNSALVYLFRDSHNGNSMTHGTTNIVTDNSPPCNNVRKYLLFKALLIALAASHGYIVIRLLVRHLLSKIFWAGCKERKEAERNARDMKEQYFKNMGAVADGGRQGVSVAEEEESKAFWSYDEGLDEIRKVLKDA